MKLFTKVFRHAAPVWCLSLIAQAQAQILPPDMPEAYEQILPRGQIPAIFSPQYVPAGQADIDDDAWILGVVINGQARAYSLRLLNQHEIVNDRIGDTAFAAVW